MSKHQVIGEYLAGRIDRRGVIVKLTTVGVSAAAAIAYADTMAQSVAASGAGKDARGYVMAFQSTSNYPVLDTDNDGFTDEEEAACGSDPKDPNSFCKSSPSNPATGLPNTGVGPASEHGSGWLAPVAAAGAGLALLSRKLRRSQPND